MFPGPNPLLSGTNLPGRLGRVLPAATIQTDGAGCPCDTGLPYGQCCRPFHEGALAPTAVQLMRSRYSAFALGLEAHLVRTWHPRTRPETLDLDDGTTWLGLTVHRTEAGLAGDETGVVEFTARWQAADGTLGSLHEVSRFARRANRWLYLDGTLLDS